eukprot:Em0007g555a
MGPQETKVPPANQASLENVAIPVNQGRKEIREHLAIVGCLGPQVNLEKMVHIDKFIYMYMDDKTSKTISREKGQRIVNVIKKNPSAVTYSSQFKFSVKKKHFELIASEAEKSGGSERSGRSHNCAGRLQ